MSDEIEREESDYWRKAGRFKDLKGQSRRRWGCFRRTAKVDDFNLPEDDDFVLSMRVRWSICVEIPRHLPDTAD